jgi:MFS superfamily sulfate permease-like transporter
LGMNYSLTMSLFWYALLAIAVLVAVGYSAIFLASRVRFETAAAPERVPEAEKRTRVETGERRTA